jgi:hypothetical protein
MDLIMEIEGIEVSKIKIKITYKFVKIFLDFYGFL